MASLHKDLLICVLYKHTAKRSQSLISNVWLMSDELMVGRKYNGCHISFGCKPESRWFDLQWGQWNFSLT